MKPSIIRLIAWEITRTCSLNCRHCRASAQQRSYEGELSTGECEKLLENISGIAKPIIILTGGEPMMRGDIYHIAEFGHDLGLRMVMASCGIMLTDDTCRRLMQSGIQRISLSIDGATPESHDAFRGVQGAFEGTLRGVDAARRTGLKFQINTTVTKINLHELPRIYELAASLGAVSFHPFLLVPTGRGREISDKELSPEEYEDTLNWIYQHRADFKMTIKPTCAPHYYRILREQEKQAGRTVKPETHGLDAMTKGCLGGQGFAFISHVGDVQICGFLDVSAGNVRENGFDFRTIWFNSELFRKMRDYKEYQGKCGYCGYNAVCGGCRARAYAMTGDYMAPEPLCVFEPKTRKSVVV